MRLHPRHILPLAILTLGAGSAVAGLLSAHGPFPGATGAPAVGGKPAEFECTLCHEDAPLNAPGGSIDIEGLPAVYQPGQTYRLVVRLASTATVADEGRKWGFELVAVRRSNGASAGTILLDDPDTLQVIPGDGPLATRDYVEHTFEGTRDGLASPATWTFRWTAPSAGQGTVLFFAAGNAANGTGGPDGDNVYTTSDSTREHGSVNVTPPPFAAHLALSAPRPNPARGATAFAYTLPGDGRVELTVHDASGRRVRRLLDGPATAISGTVNWDRRDDAGRLAPAGVYFVRLVFAGATAGTAERRVVLVD